MMLLLLVVACWITPVAAERLRVEPRGLSVIVVPTQAEATDLRVQIQAGASFEVLAVKRSVAPSAAAGGYLGTFDTETLRPEFQTELARLKPGDVSRVTRVGNEFVLLRWATADEQSWWSQNDAGLQALQQGRYPEAAQLFLASVQKATKFGPEDYRLAQSLNGLAQAYRLQGNIGDAESLARRSLAILEKVLGPEHAGVLQSLENLAPAVAALGSLVEAGRLYQRILSIRCSEPSGPVSLNAVQTLENFAAVLSLGYFRDAELGQALKEYRKTLAQAPLNKDVYAVMRDGLLGLTLVSEAEAVMQRAVQAFPDSRQVRYELAEFYLKSEKFSRAIEVFEEASRLKGPPDPAADRLQRSLMHQRIGEMNEMLFRFDDALSAYRTALEINPDNIASHLALGGLYLQRDLVDKALAEYNRVTSTHFESADAHYGLAEANLRLGRFAESAAAAEKALTIDPKHQRSRYVRAVALIRAGRSEEGQNALEEYLRANADLQAEERRVRSLASSSGSVVAKLAEGEYEEAIRQLRERIDAEPGAAGLYLELGLIQSRMGWHMEAVRTFQTMIGMGLDGFLVHRNLYLQYEILGNTSASQHHRVIYLQKYDALLKLKASLN